MNNETREQETTDGFVPGSRPICGFCNAPWTDDMISVMAEADVYGGYYPGEFEIEGIDTQIDVICSNCKRLIYRKEIRVPNGSP